MLVTYKSRMPNSIKRALQIREDMQEIIESGRFHAESNRSIGIALRMLIESCRLHSSDRERGSKITYWSVDTDRMADAAREMRVFCVGEIGKYLSREILKIRKLFLEDPQRAENLEEE